jgi:hypothetical protein
VVDDQADGYRDVFVKEEANRLTDAVFVDREVLPTQVRNGAPAAIANGGINNHQVDVDRKFVGIGLLLRRPSVTGEDDEERRGKHDAAFPTPS